MIRLILVLASYPILMWLWATALTKPPTPTTNTPPITNKK
jgi:hypothetical protein